MEDLTIRRDYYVEKLLGRQMNGFVKVITGIRRCGKSFLLNTLFRQHEIDFVVNRGNDKLYIQSALRLDDETKERQETASLRGTGDFFKKVVITDGYDEPHADGEGIIRVGVLPFLLDETIMKRL